MTETKTDQQTIRQYLLGQLSEPAQIRLEEQLLSDAQFYHEILAAEDELTDDYLSGALSTGEREAFERFFLIAPARQEKLKIARALRKYVKDQTRAPARSWRDWSVFSWFANPALGFASAMVAILVLLAAGWLLRENWLLKDRLVRLQTNQSDRQQRVTELQKELDQQRQQQLELKEELARLKNPPKNEKLNPAKPESVTAPSVFSFFLLPGISRDPAEVVKLKIPEQTTQLNLLLGLEQDDGQYYRAELFDQQGKLIWRIGSLRAQRAENVTSVLVKSLISAFNQGNYHIVLSEPSPDGSYQPMATYYFQISK